MSQAKGGDCSCVQLAHDIFHGMSEIRLWMSRALSAVNAIWLNSFADAKGKHRPELGFGHYEVLSSLLEEVGQGRQIIWAVELGVNHGWTSQYILERHPNLRLYGVDFASDKPLQEAAARYSKFVGRAVLFTMTGTDAASSLADGFFDLVYIDADHSYAGVKEDIANWRRKVRGNGILAGHDYDWESPGVFQAVQELALETGWLLYTSGGGVWFFRIPSDLDNGG